MWKILFTFFSVASAINFHFNFSSHLLLLLMKNSLCSHSKKKITSRAIFLIFINPSSSPSHFVTLFHSMRRPVESLFYSLGFFVPFAWNVTRNLHLNFVCWGASSISRVRRGSAVFKWRKFSFLWAKGSSKAKLSITLLVRWWAIKIK